MSEKLHSPAPWKVIGKQGASVWSGDNIIASMTSPRIRAKVAHADAVLMAAAPELAEMVRELASALDNASFDHNFRRPRVVDKALALADRAEGIKP